jgi:hypothetical protein
MSRDSEKIQPQRPEFDATSDVRGDDLLGEEYANDPVADSGGQGNIKLSGSAYRIHEATFNKQLWDMRIPREYWAIKRDDVTFKTFSQKPHWRSKKAPFMYQASKQIAFYQYLLDLIRDDTKDKPKLDWYNGRAIFISSNPTDRLAACAAGHIVTEMCRYRESPRIKWVDAVELAPWGKPPAPDPKMAPELLVIAGLYPNPTRESVESVRRWYVWGRHSGICVFVGSGADPVDLAVNWYRISPFAALYALGTSRRITVHG